MSDEPELVELLEDQGESTEPPAEQESDELPELSDYGKRFLSTVPEEEKPYAEKYVRQWDAGHKKQVEPLKQRVDYYNGLGNEEELTGGVQLYRLLVTQPERVLEWLVNERGLTLPQAKAAVREATDDAEQQTVDPYAEKYTKLEKELMELKQYQLQRAQMEQLEQQKAQFLSDLMAAKKTFGDFDQDHVIEIIAAGKAESIEEAVQLSLAREQQILQRKGRATAPNLLGSGSAPPVGGKKVDWGKASDKDVTAFLTQALGGN